MSEIREQALIDAPPEEVWSLVGDPARYPEWWVDVTEVDGERFEEGTEYLQVTHGDRTTFKIDKLERLHEVRTHCTLSGVFAHWRLTPAQGGTFLDVTFGIEPTNLRWAVYEKVRGRRLLKRWMNDSIESLRNVLAAGRLGAATESGQPQRPR
jgi:uncharacterized protein YndB with AHSA1/START domain